MDQSDRTTARQALAEAGTRVVNLLRKSDPDAPVVGSDWRVVEVAAHLSYLLEGFTIAAAGSPARFKHDIPGRPDFHERMATVNERLVRTTLEENAGDEQMDVTIGLIEERVAAFLAATGGRAPDDVLETPWYGPGMTRTTDTLTALALGEILLHGLDLGRTASVHWPLDRTVAAVTSREVFAHMMPLMLTDAGRKAKVSYRVKWRGIAPGTVADLVLKFDSGTVTSDMDAPFGRADCVLWTDPVAFMLIGYGRTEAWREIAAGRMMCWGRRPAAAIRLPNLFCNP
jgi:Mycothiol maleylpyruvate isomerase N-terminal domain